MPVLKTISSPIKTEMSLFEKKFKSFLNNDVKLLDRILHYIIKRKGKQMRPMFVFLSAKLFGQVNEKTYRAASMIELLHTATLVHDDVVDNSNLRRGFFSINAIWKNKIAVLVGDFLLSKGLLLAVRNQDFDLLKIISTAVQQMSEGELLQIENSRRLTILEEIYFEIIKKKTGALIGACCASGANSVEQNSSSIKKMAQFGEKVGICFQIKDDLFDYEGDYSIGKPIGIDIQDKKLTLPLIYTLNNSPFLVKKKIINIIKSQNQSKTSEVISLVKKYGGVKYAKEKMMLYHDDAVNMLKEFKDSKTKKSLILLLEYVTKRKK
ncbi:MAG: polyprenyl synthetase family protein [Bacteroidota bacterium]|nr:polyprenyl synthetase family protein [Bacteroidota bacterium]